LPLNRTLSLIGSIGWIGLKKAEKGDVRAEIA
jgi:hypothetical protein